MHINDVRTRQYDQACPVNAHMVYVDHVGVYVRSNTPPTADINFRVGNATNME